MTTKLTASKKGVCSSTGQPPKKSGRVWTEEEKSHLWKERHRPIEERQEEQLVMLRALGQCEAWEFGEHFGCSPKAARDRLNGLVDAGLATSWRTRGRHGYIYTATIGPGASVTG